MSRTSAVLLIFLAVCAVMVGDAFSYYRPCILTYNVKVNGQDLPNVPVVGPGAAFTVSFSYRIWSAEEGPSYVWCGVIGVDEDAQTEFYYGIPGVYPGRTGTWSGTLTAPSTPGAYGIYILIEPTVDPYWAYYHYENLWIYNWGAIAAIYVQATSTEGSTLGEIKAMYK